MTTPSPRLPILLLAMALAGTGALAGCRKDPAATAEAAAARSLDDLRSQLGQLKTRFADLRRQVETVPPDRPGFQDVRARFYAVEEARGITDLKATLLASRLASASGAAPRQCEKLRQIAKEIADTHDEIRQIGELHTSLQRQLRAVQANAARGEREVEAATSAGGR